jgi:hypothetical protein
MRRVAGESRARLGVARVTGAGFNRLNSPVFNLFLPNGHILYCRPGERAGHRSRDEDEKDRVAQYGSLLTHPTIHEGIVEQLP